MKNLQEKFKEFILFENLFSPNDKLLVAVSGGLDSAVLCALCHQSGFEFVIAHCNFQLRSAESDRDEEFVKNLAQKYEKESFVKKFETEEYARENKISIQVAARKLRYDWFDELVNNEQGHLLNPIRFILTAHHLDDSVETLLMNFCKGTGISGLHGILPKQGKIVRPLLFAKKEELQNFALVGNLQWVEDSSNQADSYSRNYLRHHIIPSLTKIYPNIINNLSENINRFKEVELLYRQSVSLHKKKLIEQRGKEFHIPILKLKKTIPLNTIVYEIIRDYDFSPLQVHDVVGLLD